MRNAYRATSKATYGPETPFSCPSGSDCHHGRFAAYIDRQNQPATFVTAGRVYPIYDSVDCPGNLPSCNCHNEACLLRFSQPVLNSMAAKHRRGGGLMGS